MRTEDILFLEELAKKEAAEAKLQAVQAQVRNQQEAARARRKAALVEGRKLQEQMSREALSGIQITVNKLLKKLSDESVGLAKAWLNYELLPCLFTDSLSYGQFRWFVDTRIKHAPREVQKSFRAMTTKDLRNTYEGLWSLRKDAQNHPEDYPGWMVVRAEKLPFNQQVKRTRKLVKTWLGEGSVIYTV